MNKHINQSYFHFVFKKKSLYNNILMTVFIIYYETLQPEQPTKLKTM